MGVSLFRQLTNDGINGLKSYQERFRLDIRSKIVTKRVIRHWNKFPWEMVESLPLEVFQRYLGVALGNDCGGDAGLTVGLDSPGAFFQP